MEINVTTDIKWCSQCNVPFLGKTCGICQEEGKFFRKNLKPIFPKEADLLLKNVKSEKDINDVFLQSKFLFRSRNHILDEKGVVGKISVPKPETFEIILKKKRQDFYSSKKGKQNVRIKNWDQTTPYERKLVQASLPFLQELENEAISFIRDDIWKKYPKGEFKYFISFSGGKDSTIVSYLIRQAFPELEIPLLFINTTIEMPETLKFAQDFANWIKLPLYEIRNSVEFLKLCEELGPPSRMMRWCCTTQKGAPVNEFYKKYGVDAQILSFDGIRKDESNLRKEYPRVKKNTKMTKQLSVYPILEWSEFTVWLYILWRKIPFNAAYHFGYARIGCWACPNNTNFDWILSKNAIPDLYDSWKRFLVKFAGNNDKDEGWVLDGAWKSRKSKYRFSPVVSKTSPCALGNDVLYSFEESITPRFGEFIKIFGQTQKKGKIITFSGPYVIGNFSIGGTHLHVKFNNKNFPEHYKFRFEVQMRRALNCVECGGCIGVCLQNAISLSPGYTIDEKKCTHCMTCATSKMLKQSCVALHYNSFRKIIQNPFEFHHFTPGKNPFKKLFQFPLILAKKLEKDGILDILEFNKMELNTLFEKTGLDKKIISRGKEVIEAYLNSSVRQFTDSEFQTILNDYAEYYKVFVWFGFNKYDLQSVCYCSIEKDSDYKNPTYSESDLEHFSIILKEFSRPTLIIFFERSIRKVKIINTLLARYNPELKTFNLYSEIRNNFAIPLTRKTGDLLHYFLEAFLKTPSIPLKDILENDFIQDFPNKTHPLLNLFICCQELSDIH